MSSSSSTGHLTITTESRAKITVFDSFLRPVSAAAGIGSLSVDLAPGAYSVVSEITGIRASQNVLVRPGSEQAVTVATGVETVAPVGDVDSSSEIHAELARQLTEPRAAAGAAGLVLIVRALKDEDGTSDQPASVLDQSFTILGANGEEIALPKPLLESDVKAGSAERAIGWRLDLPPGGYRVRWEISGRQSAEHSIWLVDGLITIMFVPQGARGPVPSRASLDLIPDDEAYNAFGPGAEEVEFANTWLRGRITDTADALALLEQGEDKPVLARLFAALAVVRNPDLRSNEEVQAQLEPIVTGLHQRLGDMPDLIALATAVPGALVYGQAPFPPMVQSSLDLLLDADARDDNVIPAHSMTEIVSSHRFAAQPWLLWQPFEWPEPGVQYRADLAVGGGSSIHWPSVAIPAHGLVAADAGYTFANLRRMVAPVGPQKTDEVAMERVRAVIDEASPRLNESGLGAANKLGVDEIARRVGMTQGLVQRCLVGLYPDASPLPVVSPRPAQPTQR